MQATIFDIQRYSIHDGEGIRTLFFLKGCPLSCIWCSNPESQQISPELVCYQEKCINCNNCIKNCSTGAIARINNRITVDKKLCSLCRICVEYCYADALKMFGRSIDANEIMKEIEKDIPFYKNSNGGVTFSGGEPLTYDGFINAVAKKCHKLDIPIAIETCGHIQQKNLSCIIDNDNINTIMFDIKHMNPVVHQKLCGHSNDLILNNLKHLTENGIQDIIVRIPIIPNFNDSIENISMTAEFIKGLNKIKRIDILPYHNFGMNKYHRLGLKYSLKETTVPDDAYMEKIKIIFEEHDINIQIGG
jgi:pyruvate formate lyase activating enzyme